MSSIAEYCALRPSNYGPIVSLEFHHAELADGAMGQELIIVLSRRPELSGDRLLLRFRGVRELRFEQPPWSLASFGLIEIHESESGFRATEEDGLISFRFTSFDARLENTPMEQQP